MEKNIIICVPSKYITERKIKSIEVFCLHCSVEVLLADSTINSVKQHESDLEKNPPLILCIDCGFKHLKTKENPNFVPFKDEQINEIND